MTDISLPSGFELLERFVPGWTVQSSDDRDRLRGESAAEARAEFFAAMRGQLEPALTLLDAKPVTELQADEKRLLSLILSFAHVSLAEEVQRDHEPRHAVQRRFLRITTAPGERALR